MLLYPLVRAERFSLLEFFKRKKAQEQNNFKSTQTVSKEQKYPKGNGRCHWNKLRKLNIRNSNE